MITNGGHSNIRGTWLQRAGSLTDPPQPPYFPITIIFQLRTGPNQCLFALRYYLYDPFRHQYWLWCAREVRLSSDSNLAQFGAEAGEGDAVETGGMARRSKSSDRIRREDGDGEEGRGRGAAEENNSTNGTTTIKLPAWTEAEWKMRQRNSMARKVGRFLICQSHHSIPFHFSDHFIRLKPF